MAIVGTAQAILCFSQSPGAAFRVWIGTSEVLTLDAPRAEGPSQVVFHRYPDGLFMSARSFDVVLVESLKAQGAPPSSNEGAQMRVSESVVVSAPSPGLQPGEVVDLGLTGGPSNDLRERAAALAAKAAAQPVRAPGEGARGKALFNPERDYRPEWDSKLVPGYSMPYANSPNDILEGKTMSYPPGSGKQLSPGAPPTMINEGMETPKVLSRPGGWDPPTGAPSISPPVTAERGADVPRVPDVHDVPRVSYDPNLPPPPTGPVPTPAAPPKR